jgi:hypothetical protein
MVNQAAGRFSFDKSRKGFDQVQQICSIYVWHGEKSGMLAQ